MVILFEDNLMNCFCNVNGYDFGFINKVSLIDASM